jgi:hypothetical protein
MRASFSTQSIAWSVQAEAQLPMASSYTYVCNNTLLRHFFLSHASAIVFVLISGRCIEQLVACVWDEHGRRIPSSAPQSPEQMEHEKAEALALLQQLCNRHLHSFIPKKASRTSARATLLVLMRRQVIDRGCARFCASLQIKRLNLHLLYR